MTDAQFSGTTWEIKRKQTRRRLHTRAIDGARAHADRKFVLSTVHSRSTTLQHDLPCLIASRPYSRTARLERKAVNVSHLVPGHPMSRVQTRRRVASLVALALSLAPAARAPMKPFYRIFLTDGSALASYGEFARVADTVVFSMPLGGTAAEPRLELVTVPAAKVDWPATERAPTRRVRHITPPRAARATTHV